MKTSLGSAAAALKGFAEWISVRGERGFPDAEAPHAIADCEALVSSHDAAAEPGEFSERGERWSPGLSVDNFF